MTANIQDKVIQVVADALEISPEQISLESSFEDDLGADSLKKFQLIMAFEDTFGIDIPDEESQKIATVQDIVMYIQSKDKVGQN